MAPIKAGKYEYKAETLVHLREQIGLTQAEMAKLLGVPANTLSRWETGTTTPDAESLAAIYSFAIERGITPNFFPKRRPSMKPTKGRSRLLVMWDFQNIGVPSDHVKEVNSWIRTKLDGWFPNASYRRYKAYASPQQAAATDELERLGWRVWEDDEDIDDEIIAQAKSDCGQEATGTTLVLIANDGDYMKLVAELKTQGVVVCLLTSPHTCNEKLAEEVGKKRLIQFPQQIWEHVAETELNRQGEEKWNLTNLTSMLSPGQKR